MASGRWRVGLRSLAGLAVAAVLSLGFVAEAQARKPPAADVPTIELAQLPPEAQGTCKLITSGGPFPHEKDGVVFGNRERQLPPHPRGYYHEYTVRTPGSRDRGARRIVCGGENPTAPQACYYTSDHYASFRRIVE